LCLGSEGCSPASQSKIDDITKKVVKYEDISKMKGYIPISSMPGLGIEIYEDKINKYKNFIINFIFLIRKYNRN